MMPRRSAQFAKLGASDKISARLYTPCVKSVLVRRLPGYNPPLPFPANFSTAPLSLRQPGFRGHGDRPHVRPPVYQRDFVCRGPTATYRVRRLRGKWRERPYCRQLRAFRQSPPRLPKVSIEDSPQPCTTTANGRFSIKSRLQRRLLPCGAAHPGPEMLGFSDRASLLSASLPKLRSFPGRVQFNQISLIPDPPASRQEAPRYLLLGRH